MSPSVISNLPGVAPQLVKGGLKNDKLEGWNYRTGKYDPAIKPDFIWLRRVSIPPRPMLPTGAAEIVAQQEFAIDLLAQFP